MGKNNLDKNLDKNIGEKSRFRKSVIYTPYTSQNSTIFARIESSRSWLSIRAKILKIRQV